MNLIAIEYHLLLLPVLLLRDKLIQSKEDTFLLITSPHISSGLASKFEEMVGYTMQISYPQILSSRMALIAPTQELRELS
jgi:hypothetical protein